MKLTPSLLLVISIVLGGCSLENVISRDEIHIQKEANYAVAELLFDKDINDTASYKVQKNGSVIIKFDRSVSEDVYTNIVTQLRADKRVTEVYAEQEGREVCPSRL